MNLFDFVIKRFLIALQFLTSLPIYIKSEIKDKDFGASLLYFPLVGSLIGLILAGSAFLLSSLPPFLKSALILLFSIIITGGIHLDGFADTCDGFYGNKPKEKILEIMRGSRIGTMGVTGITMLLLLKFSLLISISQENLWKLLILTLVFSRWVQIWACFSSCYAREDGKARYFIEYAGYKEIIPGTIFSLVIFWGILRLKGVILFVIAMLPIFLFINYIKRRLGGMTGDTIGAINEIAEVVLLFLGIIFINIC